MKRIFLLMFSVVTFFSCSTSEDIEKTVSVENAEAAEMEYVEFLS